MNRTLICVVFCLFAKYVDSQANYSFIITPKMAQLCKEHISQDGYNYKTFYSVDNDNLKEIKKDADVAFEMHIGIQASSNGHILLSPVPKPGYNDAVYEIVVGGGGNQFTELRRNTKRNARSSVKTPKILSTFELRGFYIKISQGLYGWNDFPSSIEYLLSAHYCLAADYTAKVAVLNQTNARRRVSPTTTEGLIEFGKEGEVLPLLSYIDLSPLEIKYFSFAAWTGIEAKFLYDCPIPTGNGIATPDSQEIEPPLSTSDQLKRTLLLYRWPWIPPKPTMNVKLGIKVTSIKYDAFESKMITTLSVVTSWTDDSMAWYPLKYNGTTSLKFRQGQIWRPKFYVFNSDNAAMFDARNSELISMVYSGEATFHFQTKVSTWCVEDPEGFSKWPHDEYYCHIIIQPWEAHEKISIEIIDPNDRKMIIFSDIDKVIENEWIVDTTQLIIQPGVWNQVYNNQDNQTHQSDRLFINVKMKRRATSYNIVFYTPLLVLLFFVLMSFWSEPLTMERIWFLAGCTIVICMGLCYVDYLIPSHTLPSILVLYTTILGGVLLALLIQVLLMTTAMENICKSETMQKIMTAYIFRTIFCLPAYMATSDRNGRYSVQEDEEPQATPITGDIEEMESENQKTFGDKKELAEVIDRILFVIYSITFAVMLAAHF